MSKQYYVYILANDLNTVIYTGVTNDLDNRLRLHRTNYNPNSFTARYSVHKLVYYEIYGEITSAIAREKQIKSWKRNRKNELVESKNPNWDELAPYKK